MQPVASEISYSISRKVSSYYYYYYSLAVCSVVRGLHLVPARCDWFLLISLVVFLWSYWWPLGTLQCKLDGRIHVARTRRKHVACTRQTPGYVLLHLWQVLMLWKVYISGMIVLEKKHLGFCGELVLTQYIGHWIVGSD